MVAILLCASVRLKAGNVKWILEDSGREVAGVVWSSSHDHSMLARERANSNVQRGRRRLGS